MLKDDFTCPCSAPSLSASLLRNSDSPIPRFKNMNKSKSNLITQASPILQKLHDFTDFFLKRTCAGKGAFYLDYYIFI